MLMLDMDKAAARLKKAIAGARPWPCTATTTWTASPRPALLTDWLRSVGLDVVPYIPDSIEEGYGLNPPP
jgi:single-stranded-DNA-specific exonuclease